MTSVFLELAEQKPLPPVIRQGGKRRKGCRRQAADDVDKIGDIGVEITQ